MNMVGDMGRYTQYEVAQAIPIAAANEGGGAAGVGAGLGAGVAMGQAMMDALKKTGPAAGESGTSPGGLNNRDRKPGQIRSSASTAASLFRKSVKFCAECGHAQQ
jgi:membrane protease subunit (stomatin/prohibitin family)